MWKPNVRNVQAECPSCGQDVESCDMSFTDEGDALCEECMSEHLVTNSLTRES